MFKIDFKSSGVSLESAKKKRDLEESFEEQKSFGIKTPMKIGSTDVYETHKNLSDQIRDNFRNLLLTNKGERLGRQNFGADLRRLAIEYYSIGEDEFINRATSNIKSAAVRFMPFIELDTFEFNVEEDFHNNSQKANLKISYDVPSVSVFNQAINFSFYLGALTDAVKNVDTQTVVTSSFFDDGSPPPEPPVPDPPPLAADDYIAVAARFEGTLAFTSSVATHDITSLTPAGEHNAFVMCCKTDGELVWVAQVTNTNNAEPWACEVDPNDGSIYVGYHYQIDSTVADSNILNIYNGDSTLYATRSLPSESGGSGQLWMSVVVKYDGDTGAVQWQQGFGTREEDHSSHNYGTTNHVTSLAYNRFNNKLVVGFSHNGGGDPALSEQYDFGGNLAPGQFSNNNHNAAHFNMDPTNGSITNLALTQHSVPTSTGEYIHPPSQFEPLIRDIDIDPDNGHVYIGLRSEKDSGSRVGYFNSGSATTQMALDPPDIGNFHWQVVKANSSIEGEWSKKFVSRTAADGDQNAGNSTATCIAALSGGQGVIVGLTSDGQNTTHDHWNYYDGGNATKVGEFDVLEPLIAQRHNAIVRLDTSGSFQWFNTLDSMSLQHLWVNQTSGSIFAASNWFVASDDLAWGSGSGGPLVEFNQTQAPGACLSKWSLSDGSFDWAAPIDPINAGETKIFTIFVDSLDVTTVLMAAGGFASSEPADFNTVNSSDQSFSAGSTVSSGSNHSLRFLRYNSDGTINSTEFVVVYDFTYSAANSFDVMFATRAKV